jgi:hypothetical protein
MKAALVLSGVTLCRFHPPPGAQHHSTAAIRANAG